MTKGNLSFDIDDLNGVNVKRVYRIPVETGLPIMCKEYAVLDIGYGRRVMIAFKEVKHPRPNPTTVLDMAIDTGERAFTLEEARLLSRMGTSLGHNKSEEVDATGDAGQEPVPESADIR